MTDIEARWNFPRANGSRSHGFKEAGFSTFSGDIMPSLVREICQNSLDAAESPSVPVRVEFEKYVITPQEIPGRGELSSAVGRAIPYWNSKRNNEVKEYLVSVGQILTGSSPISVLRAGDFHTTGLRGAYEDRIDDWNRLTKLDGGATKSGTSAGSYGIGKNAPFTASSLRLVFYRTLTNESAHCGRAAQGIVYLPAFAEQLQNEISTYTLGLGYYGDPGDEAGLANRPIPTIPLLDRLCPRTEIGSDVFVFGFSSDKTWMDTVAAEVLESFLLAIHERMLEVCIADGSQRINITADTLPRLMDSYAKKAKNAAAYFRILSEPESVETYEQDFHNLGTLKLRLLSNTAQPLNRKILVTRSSKMKIQAIDRLRGHMNFTGILELQGDPLNEMFRALETPQHNAWQADRYTKNPSLAKKYIQELRRWVRETVAQAAATTTTDQVYVKGLPDNLHAADRRSGSSKSTQTAGEPQGIQVTVQEEAAQTPGRNDLVRRDGAQAEENGTDAVLAGSGQIPRPRNRRLGRSGKLGGGGRGSSRKSPGTAGGSQPQAVGLAFVRLVRAQDGRARLVLETPWTVERGTILLRIVGENGKAYRKVRVYAAECASEETEVYAARGRIHFENLPGRTKTVIQLVLGEKMPYAAEVLMYEDR